MLVATLRSRGPQILSLFALLAVTLVAAGCGGGSSSQTTTATPGGGTTGAPGTTEDGTVVYGSLPPVGTPVSGGTISFAQISDGGTPTEILPLLSDQNTSTADFMFNAALYLPLFNGPKGAVPTVDYSQSVAAGPPKFADSDRTVTIALKPGLKWSDGAPVDADDVLFYIALAKAAVKESPADWSQYIPGQFPADVTSDTAPNAHTVVLHLDRGYNPGYFVENQMEDTGGGVFPMPATDWDVASAHGRHLTDWRSPAVARRIYNYLSRQGTAIASFASDPLWKDGDGAFELTSFSATNGAYTLVPNRSYGLSPKPRFAKLQVQSYTSQTAALDALEGGSVDVVPLDSSQLGSAATLRRDGDSVFGAPSFGWAAGTINFKDTAGDFDHIIAQLYVRQALERLIDQPELITHLYKGAAAEAYGPVPSAPSSPYASASAKTAPYPYSPTAAAALLRTHGWKVVPGGKTTCAKPGTGRGECGAGIPAGTPIAFVWATAPPSVSSAEVLDTEDISSLARKVLGIDIAVQQKSSDFLSTDYNDADPQAARYTSDWGVLNTQPVALTDYYPTQAGFDTPGALDLGGYDSATENRLIAASVHSGKLRAVENEATYIAHDLPQLFLPNPDVLFAVSKDIGGPASSWTVLSEGAAFFPQYWYRTTG